MPPDDRISVLKWKNMVRENAGPDRPEFTRLAKKDGRYCIARELAETLSFDGKHIYAILPSQRFKDREFAFDDDEVDTEILYGELVSFLEHVRYEMACEAEPGIASLPTESIIVPPWEEVIERLRRGYLPSSGGNDGSV
jgi:hypothetical protein